MTFFNLDSCIEDLKTEEEADSFRRHLGSDNVFISTVSSLTPTPRDSSGPRTPSKDLSDHQRSSSSSADSSKKEVDILMAKPGLGSLGGGGLPPVGGLGGSRKLPPVGGGSLGPAVSHFILIYL